MGWLGFAHPFCRVGVEGPVGQTGSWHAWTGAAWMRIAWTCLGEQGQELGGPLAA